MNHLLRWSPLLWILMFFATLGAALAGAVLYRLYQYRRGLPAHRYHHANGGSFVDAGHVDDVGAYAYRAAYGDEDARPPHAEAAALAGGGGGSFDGGGASGDWTSPVGDSGAGASNDWSSPASDSGSSYDSGSNVN